MAKVGGGYYGEAIYRQATGWIVGLVLFGLLMPGINNWAHGGGLVAGILLGFLLRYEERFEETSLQQTLGAGCMLLTASILLWAVMRALFSFFMT